MIATIIAMFVAILTMFESIVTMIVAILAKIESILTMIFVKRTTKDAFWS